MNPKPQRHAGQHFGRQDARTGAERSFWSELGLPETEYLDDSLAPKVDEALLLKLVRQELPEDLARPLYRLIYSFASWHQAYSAVLIDEFKKARQANTA